MNARRASLGDRTPTIGRRLVLPAALLLVAACHGEDAVIEGGAHEPVAQIEVDDARSEVRRARNLDPSVVYPLMTPQVPGRILYDPPPSLARVAAADTIVRRANTMTSAPETPGRVAQDTAAARASAADARRGAGTRDTTVGRP